MFKPSHLTAALLLCAAAGSANACGPEPYLGQVCTFAFNFCPDGYLPADGRLLAINSNTALYSLLGVTYGGDGTTTFALPDLRGRAVVGTGPATGPTSQVNLGQMRGQESWKLQANQLPATPVSVTFNVSQSNGTNAVPNAGDMLAVSNAGGRGQPLYIPSASAGNQVALGGAQGQLQGGGQPIVTLPPELGMTQCIAAQGVFPPRP